MSVPTSEFSLEVPFRGDYHLHRVSHGEGPARLAVVAGIHGNEVDGMLAVNHLSRALSAAPPDGTVHLLPCVNTLGAEEGRKRWPFDDRDINRAFPGDPGGLPVERIAHAVLAATDAPLCVAVETGASTIRELPHVRASNVPIAGMLGLPVVAWVPDGIAAAWETMGRSVLVLRGGQAGTLSGAGEVMGRALVALVEALGRGGEGASGEGDRGKVLGTEEIRSENGGFFVPLVEVGARVEAGQPLGEICRLIGGGRVEAVVAPVAGLVLAVRVYPLVHDQELLFRLGV